MMDGTTSAQLAGGRASTWSAVATSRRTRPGERGSASGAAGCASVRAVEGGRNEEKGLKGW